VCDTPLVVVVVVVVGFKRKTKFQKEFKGSE